MLEPHFLNEKPALPTVPFPHPNTAVPLAEAQHHHLPSLSAQPQCSDQPLVYFAPNRSQLWMARVRKAGLAIVDLGEIAPGFK